MKQYQKLIAMSRMHLANGNERAYKAQISGLLRSARSARARNYLLDEMAADGFWHAVDENGDFAIVPLLSKGKG